MLRSTAETFERFGRTYCLHLQVRRVTKDGHTTLSGNVRKFTQEKQGVISEDGNPSKSPEI